MKRIRMMVAALRMLVVMTACAATVAAHVEPPKTSDELQQKEQARSTFAQHKVLLQHAWVVHAATATRPADSTLWQTNHFDMRGNMVEQVTFDSTRVTRYISKYGDRNVWLEELIYTNDSLGERTVFVYLPDGLIHQILSFDVLGGLNGKLDYSYHESTDEIIATKRTAEDSLVYTIIYRYAPGEEMQNNIGSQQMKADGSLMIKVENSFEGTRRVSKVVFAPDGAVNRRFRYQYTDSGEFAEITTTGADGVVLSVQSYIYSSDGLLKELVTRNQAGDITKLIRYHYEYYKDPLGNG